MNDVRLALRNVSFGYELGRKVLRQVSLEIRAGDRIGLSGANGAGKSTLLHVMVGLLWPQDGSIEAFGRTCRSEKDFRLVRRRVGLMFQDSDDQLFCPTVLEDVAFGPLNLGYSSAEARRLALQALDQVGMSAYSERIPHHLSAGEKKLIALATVLAMHPDVLLLDEPTAGLDPDASRRMVTALRGLNAAQLIVSQDAGFLRQTTCRRLELQGGILVEISPAEKTGGI